jgi:hypothetical protein
MHLPLKQGRIVTAGDDAFLAKGQTKLNVLQPLNHCRYCGPLNRKVWFWVSLLGMSFLSGFWVWCKTARLKQLRDVCCRLIDFSDHLDLDTAAHRQLRHTES